MLKDLSYEELIILEKGLFDNALDFLVKHDTKTIAKVTKFVKRWPKMSLCYAGMSKTMCNNLLRIDSLDKHIAWVQEYPKVMVWLDGEQVVDYKLTKEAMLRDTKSLPLFVFIDTSINPDIVEQLEALKC